MGFNLKNEEEVKEFLDKLQIEYQFSCYRENNAEGCCLLGEFMSGIREDYPKAATAFKKACDQFSFPKACFKYGGFLLKGRAMKKDFAKALEYQEKACELGWKEACCVAGSQHLDPQQPNFHNTDKAIKYFVRACEMDSDVGCDAIAKMYYTGMGGIPKDLQKALKFATRACDLGVLGACNTAALMYTKGRGTEVDMEKAAIFRAKAADIRQQIERMRGLDMEQGIPSDE